MNGAAIQGELRITLEGVTLAGTLSIPGGAGGLVIFAHGSGSSRLSPRNTFVARVLQNAGIGTLLFDLLTEEEDRRYETRFDIDLITERLIKTTSWLEGRPDTKVLRYGYFGASTGAAAALRAAAQLSARIGAVVSRGGRPDLAMEHLAAVRAPTLLIVGGLDDVVIELNRRALEKLTAVKKLEIVAGASHLFEEPGTLERVAELAAQWFQRYLSP